MKPGLKKSKQYTLGSGGLPESLVDRLHLIPQYFDKEKHPLLSYLDEEIVPPPGLDILLLQDSDDYCRKLNIPPFKGMYIAIPHYFITGVNMDLCTEILREDYGITTSRAALFPDDKLKYGILIHELLHDVFNNLHNADRKKILNAAKADSTKLRQLCLVPSFLLPTFGLSTRENLHDVDEFIAYFFYIQINFPLGGSLFSRYHPLPERFGKTLRDVGYKI